MADLLRSKYYESPLSYQRGYTAGFNAGMENAVKSGYAHLIPNEDETTLTCMGVTGVVGTANCCNPTCHSKTWAAYNRLLNAIHDDEATKMDLRLAIADAIKLLGETPA